MHREAMDGLGKGSLWSYPTPVVRVIWIELMVWGYQ